MNLILWLIVGGLAGWIAGSIFRRTQFGVFGNTVIGLVGGVIGGPVIGIFGLHNNGGFIGSLVTSIIGALLLLWIIAKVRER